MWYCVVWQIQADVLEKPASSTLTCPAYRGSRFFWNNGTCLPEHKTFISLSAQNNVRLHDQKTVIQFLVGGNFLLATVTRWLLKSTQHPLQWAHEALSLAVKQAEHVANHSLPSSAKCYKRQDVHLHSPRHNFCGAYLIIEMENFTSLYNTTRNHIP